MKTNFMVFVLAFMTLVPSFGRSKKKNTQTEKYKVVYSIEGQRGGGGPMQGFGRMNTVLYIEGTKAIVTNEFVRSKSRLDEDRNQRPEFRPDGGGPSAPMNMKPRPKAVVYMDYAENKWYKTETFPDGAVYTTVTDMPLPDKFSFVGVDTILNMACRHMRTSVNSNTIDMWYTDSFPVKGSPQPQLGALDGIVVKLSYNGRPGLTAKSIEKCDTIGASFPQQKGRVVEAAELKYLEDQVSVTTIDVFDNERISFVQSPKNQSFQEDRVYSVGNGTVIIKKVKLPDDIRGQSVFAKVVQYSDGDAYDRTGSIFIIPTDKVKSYMDAFSNGINSLPAPFSSGGKPYPGIVSTSDFSVPLELMRFFTPFGIRKFNDKQVWGQTWADSAVYRQEITHLSPYLHGEVWIAAYIGNWDKNGHMLSLKIKYFPEEDSRPSKTVIPLFNTVNLLEQAGQKYPDFMNRDSLHMKINIEKPVKNARLVYISTGHGGWGGGDEFNQKLNRIFMDGQLIYSYIPWRGDCATYRFLNPCSGNFSNGLSSSDLSRSNWCPGSVTQPAFIPLGDIDAGEHEFVVSINQGNPEGGSISYWCLSGAIIAD